MIMESINNKKNYNVKAAFSWPQGYINNQVTNRATGAHWNMPGHSLVHLNVIILEQSKYKDEEYKREQEKYFIGKFDTFNGGINKEW